MEKQTAKEWWQKVWERLKGVNPFFLAAVAFGILLAVPGPYSLWSQIRTGHQLREKQGEYRYYKEAIKRSQKQLDEIKYKTDMLEKYAREEYLMKEEDEDLFLLEDPDK